MPLASPQPLGQASREEYRGAAEELASIPSNKGKSRAKAWELALGYSKGPPLPFAVKRFQAWHYEPTSIFAVKHCQAWHYGPTSVFVSQHSAHRTCSNNGAYSTLPPSLYYQVSYPKGSLSHPCHLAEGQGAKAENQCISIQGSPRLISSKSSKAVMNWIRKSVSYSGSCMSGPE